MPGAEVTFQTEPLADVWDEALPLLQAHWEEIAHHRDSPLNPDRERYQGANEAGTLRVFTVRKGGSLIGYAAYFLYSSLHYQVTQAVSDVVYLDPAYRGRMLGYRFIAWCEAQLKSGGARYVYQFVPMAHDWSPMLRRRGHEVVGHVFTRRL